MSFSIQWWPVNMSNFLRSQSFRKHDQRRNWKHAYSFYMITTFFFLLSGVFIHVKIKGHTDRYIFSFILINYFCPGMITSAWLVISKSKIYTPWLGLDFFVYWNLREKKRRRGGVTLLKDRTRYNTTQK